MNLKNKIVPALIGLVTLVLAGVGVFTATKLYQLRNEGITPAAPQSKPAAATTFDNGACSGGTCSCANANCGSRNDDKKNCYVVYQQCSANNASGCTDNAQTFYDGTKSIPGSGCGTVQIDMGCEGPSGTDTVGHTSTFYPQSCGGTQTGSPGPTSGGNVCQGDCFGPTYNGANVTNCGSVGRQPGNGSCSNGQICCAPPGGNNPTATPKPEGYCDDSCTQDSDCAAQSPAGASLMCNKTIGKCVNKLCPSDTEVGNNCTCKTNAQACGQPCGSGYPLCASGFTCKYIVGPSCTAGNSSNPTTYCVPNTAPTGYTYPLCVSRDQGNGYVKRTSDNKTSFSQADMGALCNPATQSPKPTSSPSPTPTKTPTPAPTASPEPNTCILEFKLGSTPTPTPTPTATPTSSPTPTATPTSSPTPTPTGTSTPQPQSYGCNITCSTDSQCKEANKDYVCYSATLTCRHLNYPQQSNCQPPSTTTSTPRNSFECNSRCSSDSECKQIGVNYTCYNTGSETRCRMSSNPGSSTCQLAGGGTAVPATSPALPEAGTNVPTYIILGGATLLIILSLVFAL